VRISSASTFSTVFPAITECEPQELLPIMPPRVQRLCVAGSGPKVRRCFSAAWRSTSHTTPGSTRAVSLFSSTSSTRFMYLLASITTATLTLCPFIEVPAPRGSTGAPNRRQMPTALTMSLADAGSTTPIGIWR
jgi:hypothetical protein